MAKSKKLSKKDLTADERFFYDNAGWAYDPKTETEEEGRVRGAKALAKAEAWAENAGYTFVWEPEQESWEDLLGDIDPEDVSSVEWVGMYAPDNKNTPVQSLGGVVFGHTGEHAVGRVHQAELALEQFGEVFGKYGVRARNPESASTRWSAVAQRLAHGDV